MENKRKSSVAADIAVIKEKKDGKNKQLLMIKRGGKTFHGYLAFPGGFVDYNESPSNAALRELKEETGLVGKNPELIGVYGDPGRDPRGHVISIFYYITVENYDHLKAGDDASHADWYDFEDIEKEIKNNHLAFDHSKLFADLQKHLSK